MESWRCNHLKTYSDFMNEISSEELYEGLLGYGFFSEKLPPVFSSEAFCTYTKSLAQPFHNKEHGFVFFESMRDINIPRPLGIPNPMAYQRLCRCLADHWKDIQLHFETQTNNQKHKVSRIHIRKQKNSKAIFKMNYKDWKVDDSPIDDMLIGKKYVVRADISTCFQSMYTHALPWAIVGKSIAKQNRNSNQWHNQLDKMTRNLKSGETHGFLIGPHASNILSEIILTVIDRNLCDKSWEYIRNIDDYACYVISYENAQEFLTQLTEELRKFDLTLNHRKTKIEELPLASTSHWVRRLNAVDFLASYGGVNYKTAQVYIDAAIELMQSNNHNAAILNYAIKVLAKQKISANAKQYCVKTILHLSAIYPYLIPLLEQYVFVPYHTQNDVIEKFSNMIYESALKSNSYEAMIYSIYFAIKYNFKIESLEVNSVIAKKNCLFCMFAYLYFYKYGCTAEVQALREYAQQLAANIGDFDENWLFVYETLPANDLCGEWKQMKQAGISFIKTDFWARTL